MVSYPTNPEIYLKQSTGHAHMAWL